MTTDFVRITDYDLEEPLTLEMVAETTGARFARRAARRNRNTRSGLINRHEAK